jgi:hypothetical protein
MAIGHYRHVMKYERHFSNIDELLFGLRLNRFRRKEGYDVLV